MAKNKITPFHLYPFTHIFDQSIHLIFGLPPFLFHSSLHSLYPPASHNMHAHTVHLHRSIVIPFSGTTCSARVSVLVLPRHQSPRFFSAMTNACIWVFYIKVVVGSSWTDKRGLGRCFIMLQYKSRCVLRVRKKKCSYFHFYSPWPYFLAFHT